MRNDVVCKHINEIQRRKKQTQNPFDEKAAELTRVESICRKKRNKRFWFYSMVCTTTIKTHRLYDWIWLRTTVVNSAVSNVLCMDFQHLIICKRMVVHMLKMPQNERKGIERDIKYSNSMKKKTLNLGQMIKPKYKLNFQLMRHIIL